MNDKFLSLLGMARRSGKLSTGHDAVISSVVKNKAKLVVVSAEGSDRLKKEITHACSYGGKNIPVLFTSYSTSELSQAIGIKAAVISLDDEGFAKAAADKYTNDSGRKD